MKRYSEYKNSNVGWIGQIPEPWMKIKLKYCSELINGYAFSSDTYVDDGIPIVRIGDIKPNIDLADTKKIPYELFDTCRAFKINYGDILLALTGATIGKSSVYRLKENALLNQRVAIVRPNRAITNGFLENVIQSHLFKIHIDYECAGGAQDNIGKPEIGAYLVILPSIEEQKSIEKYLDHKTHLIDTLIEKKKRQIEFLKEQRAAIINQAVTKGLDPDVKMKDSGIEWLGEIPEHWEVIKIKYLAKSVVTGSTPPTQKVEYFNEGNINWYSPGDFNDNIRLFRAKRKISDKAISDGCGRLFDSKSVLIVGIGATVGKVGIIEKQGSSNQQINSITFKDDFNPYYGAYYLRSFSDYIVSLANSATLPIFNQTQTKNLFCIVPPKTEQDMIIEFINTAERDSADAISRSKRQISLLKEYRTTLISEVVTGKIDVRDEVIP